MAYIKVSVSFEEEQLNKVDQYREGIDRSLLIRWALKEYMEKWPSVGKNGGNSYGFR